MKKIIVFCCLIGASKTFAQSIDGIGQIKIGKTYEQILVDLKINSRDIKSPSQKNKLDFEDVYRPKKPILLKYDSTWTDPDREYMYLLCSEASLLIIPSYEVAEINIKKISLKFLHDTLFAIDIDSPSSEFIKAVETKFGEGELKKDTKTVKCSSAVTGSFEVEEVTYRTTWDNSEKNILAIYLLMDYRNSDCKRNFLSNFSIVAKPQDRYVTLCQAMTRVKKDKTKESELKSKLKDF